MCDKGNYKYPAWCQMETALDMYEQDRTAYLDNVASNLGSRAKEQLDQFNKAADSLAEGVNSLTGIDGISCLMELLALEEFQKGTLFELLDEHACIKFGWESLGMLSTSRERFHELLVILKDRQPCRSAKVFLQRVARCYLFGFDSECIVMCRAVLDREFKETVIDDDQVSDWWKWYATTSDAKRYRGPKPPYGQLWAKIHSACYAGMISESDRDAADNVRGRGNDAVHKKPDTGDALEVIQKTIQVLDALEKAH